MPKTNPVLILVLFLFSCTSSRTLTGKWEPVQRIITMGKETVALDVKKGSFDHVVWEFRSDSTLVFGRDTDAAPVKYAAQRHYFYHGDQWCCFRSAYTEANQ